MTLTLRADPVPIRLTADGVAFVGNARVPLDTVIFSFRDGATPEEIVHQYPALSLADVYAVIAYYLHHQAEVDAYIEQRAHESEVIRQQNEARFDPHGIRERLLARRKARE